MYRKILMLVGATFVLLMAVTVPPLQRYAKEERRNRRLGNIEQDGLIHDIEVGTYVGQPYELMDGKFRLLFDKTKDSPEKLDAQDPDATKWDRIYGPQHWRNYSIGVVLREDRRIDQVGIIWAPSTFIG